MTQFKTSASFESCLVLIKTSLQWDIHRHAHFWSKDLLIKDLLLQTPWDLTFILHTEYFADFLRYSLHFFPVILAVIHEIPYCFNFFSMTICLFSLLNSNKCSCYSVKCSALIQSFLSNMEKWIPILTVWLRSRRPKSHTLSHSKRLIITVAHSAGEK